MDIPAYYRPVSALLKECKNNKHSECDEYNGDTPNIRTITCNCGCHRDCVYCGRPNLHCCCP